MGPVLPFLSDSPAQLDAAVREITNAGASHVTPIVLHLRPGAKEWFWRWLGLNHPELADSYRQLYGNRAYAPASYQRRIADEVATLARTYGVGRATPAGARRVSPPKAGPAGQPSAPAADVQLSLL
jgi:DNA repair photolyase